VGGERKVVVCACAREGVRTYVRTYVKKINKNVSINESISGGGKNNRERG
jgi:hypothetical protein